MELRILSEAEVRAALPMEEAIVAAREAFGQLAGGEARIPRRIHLSSPGGTSLFMPGRLDGTGALGMKVVSVFEANRARGLPVIHGAVLILDPETGAPEALLEGGALTALRTGAASALATDLLARPDAEVLTVFGAGTQARAQIRGIRAVRPIRRVRVVSRTFASARTLADELEGVEARALEDRDEAVRGADVVVAATTSSTPVFDGRRVEDGCHVNAVGSYRPDMQEVDPALLARARIVVDTRDGALSEAGDLIVPLSQGLLDLDDIDAELGELVRGEAPPGREGREVTCFESVGNAAQDLAAARRVLEVARERDLGRTVRL